MHDLDRTLFETYESENPQSEESEFISVLGEVLGESSYEFSESQQSPELQEIQEIAVTSELLEVTSEAELDRFLGNLAKRASAGWRDFTSSPSGRAAIQTAKRVGWAALPYVASLGAERLVPGSGPATAAAIEMIKAGLTKDKELEGLSQEDKEFEIARTYVRFAEELFRLVAAAPPDADRNQVVRSAFVRAARRHAPGLLQPGLRQTSASTGGARPGLSGTWTRQGRRIVVHGV